jgi:hypothetical protein
MTSDDARHPRGHGREEPVRADARAGLSKRASSLLLGLLLVATATAFLITQSLKQQKSPIYATKVTKLFSPVCLCPTDSALIGFRLRHSDQLTVTILDRDGRPARTLLRSRTTKPGLVQVRWNGKLDDGRQAPDGVYHVLADLADADRSITLVANPIRLDTQPPHIRLTGTLLRPHLLELHYQLSKPAHALLYVGQQRIVYTRRQPIVGTITLIFSALSRRHLTGPLLLVGEDAAGNHSPPQLTRVKLTTNGWAHG